MPAGVFAADPRPSIAMKMMKALSFGAKAVAMLLYAILLLVMGTGGND